MSVRDTNASFCVDELREALKRLKDAEHRRRTRARRCLVATACAIAAIPALASAVEVPHVFEDGEVLSAASMNESFEIIGESLDRMVVDEDLTITVTQEMGCDRIHEAFDDLMPRRIAAGVEVEIVVGPGSYACSSTIAPTHPDGDRIVLRGGGNSPDQVELTFPPGVFGVALRRGANLGGVHNITFRGTGEEETTVGIISQHTSYVSVEDVVVEGFTLGLQASENGFISVRRAVARSNHAMGFRALLGGSMRVWDSRSESNGSDGFLVSQSEMYIRDSVGSSNGRGGFSSWDGGSLVCNRCAAERNAEHGFVAGEHGTLLIRDSVVWENISAGVRAGGGGYVWLHESELEGNGEPTAMPVNTPDPNHGAVISTP